MATFIYFLIFYCVFSYLVMIGYSWAENKKFDWVIFIISPIILPILIGNKVFTK